MKLRQLRYFAEIVESGSLSEASRRLHVVQPALSRSLADLEAELATPLLVRSRVGVQPTAAGQLLHAQARLIARQVETAAALVRECGNTPQGKLSIGVLRSDAPALAGTLFRALQQELPLVTSEIIVGYSSDLLEHLRLAELDFTMYVATPDDAHAPGTELRQERFCLLGPAPLMPTDGNSVTLDQLAGLPLLLTTKRPVHKALLFAAASRQIAINIVGGIDDSLATVELCAEGVAATLLPQASAMTLARRFGLHTALLDEPTLTRRVMLLAQPDVPRTAASLAAEHIVRRLAQAQLATSLPPPPSHAVSRRKRSRS